MPGDSKEFDKHRLQFDRDVYYYFKKLVEADQICSGNKIFLISIKTDCKLTFKIILPATNMKFEV